MISIDDVIGMSDLTEEEIMAVAEHEHIPEIAAAALADYLMHKPHGAAKIRQMILDDIRHALDHGHDEDAKRLFMALRHFVSEHPEAAES